MKLPLCFLIFSGSFILQGCVSTAQWQDKTYKPTKKGTLFYDPTPDLFDSEIVQKRRADAKMKMTDFCSPQAPQIISEKSREEVTGYRTDYSAEEDNPGSSRYYESTTQAERGHLYSHKTSSETVNPRLYSEGSKVSYAVTRNRVYIDFICK